MQTKKWLTHDWYISGSGRLSNAPVVPAPKILSQANRLRGDITSSVTLIQVMTGLTSDEQKDLMMEVFEQWVLWYYIGSGEDETMRQMIRSWKYDSRMRNIWIAEWRRRDLDLQEEFVGWYAAKMTDAKQNLKVPAEKFMYYMAREAETIWVNLHKYCLFSTSTCHFFGIVNALQLQPDGRAI